MKYKILRLLKNGKSIVKLRTNNTRAKFQSNIFIFGCAMVKKKVKCDGIIFDAVFGISVTVVRKNK